METIPLPRLGFLRGVFLANHLASTDNLTSNNKETEHIQTQTNVNTKIVLNKQKYTHKAIVRPSNSSPYSYSTVRCCISHPQCTVSALVISNFSGSVWPCPKTI